MEYNPFLIYGIQEDDEAPSPKTESRIEAAGPLLRNVRTARIVWAEDGGPIRTIIDGRKTRPTGWTPSIKAGFRSMPWDSLLEDRFVQLCDISSRVDWLMMQPHRLEIPTTGRRPLIYFPDSVIRVHPDFLTDILRGMRFIDAVTVPVDEKLRDDELETLVVEIKADVDPRDFDESYKEKLKLAKEVYRRRGWHFFELRETRHLNSPFLHTARLMEWRKAVVVDFPDVQACRAAFQSRSVAKRCELEFALGGGAYGRAKLHGLHYRQYVSIDLTNGVDKNADVYLMHRGGGAE